MSDISLNGALDSSPEKVTLDMLEEIDFDIIEDTPWAQVLWKNVKEHTSKGFLHWCKIVKNVAGSKDDQVKEWSKLYGQALDEILCDMVLDVLMIQKHTIEKIEELLKRLQKVCMELHQPVPQIGEMKRSLYEEQEQLMEYVRKYEAVVNAKKEEIKALHKKQQELCSHLGQQPKPMLHCSPLPTPEQLDDYRKCIEQLEAEVFEREEKYCQIRHEILMLVKDLKYKPTDDFEKKVLSSDQFQVTNENMNKLEFFAKCLKDIKKTTEEEILQFRSKIENLWKMLDTDLRDRDEFRTHYTGNSLDTLNALRDEVRRCEEIRKTNLKSFVEKQRVELEGLWKLCHCSEEEEKKLFKYFDNECYTEDLLDIHELEIQKWKKYYEENGKILELLEKHKKLWTKVNNLEERAADPNRFKNRGGELLKEEKHRNVLSKQIPVIEEEILKLCNDYRDKNEGVSFLSFGRTPQEYFESIHTELLNKRKLKLSARKMQRENVPPRTPAKSTMNLFPSSSHAVTPNSVTPMKRTFLATPNTEKCKRMKIDNQSKSTKKAKTPLTVPKIKTSYAPMTLPSQKRKSRSSMDKSKRRKSIKKNDRKGTPYRALAEDEVSMRTYSEFQNELSSRDVGRSTLLPETPTCSSSKKGATLRSTTKTRSKLTASTMPMPNPQYSAQGSKQYKKTPFKV